MGSQLVFTNEDELAGFLAKLGIDSLWHSDGGVGYWLDTSILVLAKQQLDGIGVFIGERELSAVPDVVFSHAEDAVRFLLGKQVSAYRERKYKGWSEPIPDESELPAGFVLTNAGSFSLRLEWAVDGETHVAEGFSFPPAAIRFSFIARWTLPEIFDAALLP